MSEFFPNSPNIRKQGKRAAAVGFVAALALASCGPGTDAEQTDKRLTGTITVDCSNRALKLPDTTSLKGRDKVKGRSILLREQQQLCTYATNLTKILVKNYSDKEGLSTGSRKVFASAEQQGGSDWEVTYHDRRDSGVSELNVTAEATVSKNNSNTLVMGKLDNIGVTYDNNTASIGLEDGIWTMSSSASLDTNWPSILDTSFVQNVGDATEKLNLSGKLTGIFDKVLQDDYKPGDRSVVQ